MAERRYTACVRFLASLYNEKANDLEDAGRADAAIEYYRRAIPWDRRWAAPWFNLGLLFKFQRNWPESLRRNGRAVELDPSHEGAWWNLGIAATALGEWHRARVAWRGCGIEVPDGEGPPVMNYGPTPIRLNPEADGEVVWCDRIDPARAVIGNVPLPASGYRYGDVVLHDRAPKGTRLLNGREVSVFDALALLTPSALGTFVARVSGVGASDAASLVRRAEAAGLHAEDWAANIRWLCTACGEGDVQHSHDGEENETSAQRAIGLAAPSEAAARAFLGPVLDAFPGATLDAFECVLPPLPVH